MVDSVRFGPLSLTLSHKGRGNALNIAGRYRETGLIPSSLVEEGQGKGVSMT